MDIEEVRVMSTPTDGTAPSVVPEQIRAAIYRARMNKIPGDPEFHVTNDGDGLHRGWHGIRIHRDGLNESHYGNEDTCAAFIDGYVAGATNYFPENPTRVPWGIET